jgi:superoxide dismutase, Fe-Mn family
MTIASTWQPEPDAMPVRKLSDALKLLPLPYALDALEPHLSRRTLTAHHGHHHAGYLEKTRAFVRQTSLDGMSLERILAASGQEAHRALFRSAAQALHHAFYWRSLRPGGGGEPRGAVAELIEDEFGPHRHFCEEFISLAGDRFDGGWAWLVLDAGRPRITATSGANSPYVTTQVPLLAIDLWEHAYYIDYQHRRRDYVAALLANVVNWEFANYNLCLELSARIHAPLEANDWSCATPSECRSNGAT